MQIAFCWLYATATAAAAESSSLDCFTLLLTCEDGDTSVFKVSIFPEDVGGAGLTPWEGRCCGGVSENNSTIKFRNTK